MVIKTLIKDSPALLCAPRAERQLQISYQVPKMTIEFFLSGVSNNYLKKESVWQINLSWMVLQVFFLLKSIILPQLVFLLITLVICSQADYVDCVKFQPIVLQGISCY